MLVPGRVTTLRTYDRARLGDDVVAGLIVAIVAGFLVSALGRSALLDEPGDDAIFGNVDDALDRAGDHLGPPRVARPAFATPTVARETAGHQAPPTSAAP